MSAPPCYLYPIIYHPSNPLDAAAPLRYNPPYVRAPLLRNRQMSSEPLTEQTFIAQMLTEIPELQPVYDEHMEFYHDKLLSHLLLWDVTRFIVSAYNRSTTADPDAERWRGVVDRSLTFMEQAISN